MDLEEIRKKIDLLDQQITVLLTERMEITNEVAEYKKAHQLPVYHPQREKEVIDKVCSFTKEEYKQALTEIYQCIMDESKKNQQRQLDLKHNSHNSFS